MGPFENAGPEEKSCASPVHNGRGSCGCNVLVASDRGLYVRRVRHHRDVCCLDEENLTQSMHDRCYEKRVSGGLVVSQGRLPCLATGCW